MQAEVVKRDGADEPENGFKYGRDESQGLTALFCPEVVEGDQL
jgi:hypothetical protein